MMLGYIYIYINQSINYFIDPYKMTRKCPYGVKEKKRREKKKKNQTMTNNTKQTHYNMNGYGLEIEQIQHVAGPQLKMDQ